MRCGWGQEQRFRTFRALWCPEPEPSSFAASAAAVISRYSTSIKYTQGISGGDSMHHTHFQSAEGFSGVTSTGGRGCPARAVSPAGLAGEIFGFLQDLFWSLPSLEKLYWQEEVANATMQCSCNCLIKAPLYEPCHRSCSAQDPCYRGNHQIHVQNRYFAQVT